MRSLARESTMHQVTICVFIMVLMDSFMAGRHQVFTGFVHDANPNVYAAEMTSQLCNMNNTMIGNKTAVLHTTHIGINFKDSFRAMTDVCQYATRTGTHTLIIAVNCTSTHYVTSVFGHINIPTIFIQQKSCDTQQGIQQHFKFQSPMVTQVAVGKSHIFNIINALISVESSENIIIFYDDVNDGVYLCDLLMSSLPVLSTAASIYEVGVTLTDREMIAILQTAKPAPDVSYPYLVLTSGNTTKYILRQAGLLKMRGRESRWILRGGSYNKHTIEPLLLDEDNIILIADGDTAAMLDKGTDMMMEALEATATTLSDVTVSDTWIQGDADDELSSKTPGCTNTISDTLRMQIAGGIQTNMPLNTMYNATYPEYTILSSVARMNQAPELEEVGTWTSDNELYVDEAGLFPNSLTDYNNRMFLVSSLEYSFFQKKVHQPDGSVKWVGLTFTLLDEIAKDLNFRYEVIEPPDLMWGIEQEDGSWNGMIAEVMNKSVDFAAAGFSVTAGRESVVDLAQPYFYETSAVILKRPENENKLSLYLKPFSWQVWVCCLISVLLYAIVLWLVTISSPFYPSNIMRKELELGGHSIKNTILYFFGCLLQQGGVWLPGSHSGRILVGCFWFFALVVVATYTGNLIATLAVNSINLPFNTLAEMVAQHKIEWGTAEGVAMATLFRDATFEPYTSVYRGMNPVNGYEEGMKRIKEGDYAFIAEKSWYQAEVAKDCSLAMMKETFYPTNYAWAFPTNAPIVNIINDRINKIRESGLLYHWIKQWTPQALNCTGLKPVTSSKTVDLTDIQGAVYVLGAGLFISLVVLTTEVLRVTSKKLKPVECLPELDESNLSDSHSRDLVSNNQ